MRGYVCFLKTTSMSIMRQTKDQVNNVSSKGQLWLAAEQHGLHGQPINVEGKLGETRNNNFGG